MAVVEGSYVIVSRRGFGDFRVGLLYGVALANDQTGLISISAVYSNKSTQDKLCGTSIKNKGKVHRKR